MPNNLGELVPQDLVDFTAERLDDDAAKIALAGALAAARRYCGWHVTPVLTAQTVTLDGPRSSLLVLPTLQLTALTALTEDGVTVDVSTLEWSKSGMVRKPCHSWWTGRLGGITATMTHGFAEAPDWQAAVLSFADRASLVGVGGDPTVVGPFQWGTETLAAGSAFSGEELSVLEQYRLERTA